MKKILVFKTILVLIYNSVIIFSYTNVFSSTAEEADLREISDVKKNKMLTDSIKFFSC